MKLAWRSMDQRRRDRHDAKADRNDLLRKWHFHFCWWPVRTGSYQLVWLETVARRNTYEGGTSVYTNWEYGPVTKLLEE